MASFPLRPFNLLWFSQKNASTSTMDNTIIVKIGNILSIKHNDFNLQTGILRFDWLRLACESLLEPK